MASSITRFTSSFITSPLSNPLPTTNLQSLITNHNASSSFLFIPAHTAGADHSSLRSARIKPPLPYPSIHSSAPLPGPAAHPADRMPRSPPASVKQRHFHTTHLPADHSSCSTPRQSLRRTHPPRRSGLPRARDRQGSPICVSCWHHTAIDHPCPT